MSDSSPNIILIVADNLGWGELGCYGGGALRGAPTPNIDRLATQGMLLHNFNVESDCVPTRSALMSGRHPIRTGCLQSVPPGLPQGLHRNETTLAQLLSEQGYATAHFGKWHLGDCPGRYPSDRGFDEWYGIPRTTDESQFTSTVGFDPTVVDLPYIMQGKKNEPSDNVKVYDLESRREIDAELVEKSIHFMKRNTEENRRFFFIFRWFTFIFPRCRIPILREEPMLVILQIQWLRWIIVSGKLMPLCSNWALHRTRCSSSAAIMAPNFGALIVERQAPGAEPIIRQWKAVYVCHLSSGGQDVWKQASQAMKSFM